MAPRPISLNMLIIIEYKINPSIKVNKAAVSKDKLACAISPTSLV